MKHAYSMRDAIVEYATRERNIGVCKKAATCILNKAANAVLTLHANLTLEMKCWKRGICGNAYMLQ